MAIDLFPLGIITYILQIEMIIVDSQINQTSQLLKNLVKICKNLFKI